MDPNIVQPYPNLTKPSTEPSWPPAGQLYYGQQPYIQSSGPVHIGHQHYIDPSIAQIRDWLPWSIVNIFIGWLLAGILPLIFSLVCRNYKRSNDASGARTMSTLALVFNILITLGGIAGWVTLIVWFVVLRETATVACINWYYC